MIIAHLILIFVREVSEHVCLAFTFVVLPPCGVAECSSTQGLSFEFIHGVHMDTCPDFRQGSSSEAATELVFNLLQTGLAQCKQL